MGIIGRGVVATAAVSSIAAPVAACRVGGADFVFLVGHEVLLPDTASLILWSFGVLVDGCLIVMVVVRHHHDSERSARHVRFGAVLAVTLVGTGTWCVGQALVLEGLPALEEDAHTVVRAPASGGCASIAHEVRALRTTRGRIDAVGRCGCAQPVGSWNADEIELLVHDGIYSVSWDGEAGTLSLGGTHAVAPDHLRVTCPRWPSEFVAQNDVPPPRP